ncbi:hypothetical protein [Blastococcus mobilis]|uniref:Uncharacterized protein n=1 Tax=Blastococcus mobilis TaxID=1938746 RepID=A0A238XU80_9ACTN|nr:hypothetical protein [Blastococcus mobilis]SNR62262.1 hypothetical protein SAMN06272737_1165 [Blastococcus mobilis]
MVHRLVVGYGQSADPAAFDAYHREPHTVATGGATFTPFEVQTASAGR